MTEPLRTEPIDMDVALVTEPLQETAQHHDTYKEIAPERDRWAWYGAYLDARQHGGSPEEAVDTAQRDMADVKHVHAPGSVTALDRHVHLLDGSNPDRESRQRD